MKISKPHSSQVTVCLYNKHKQGTCGAAAIYYTRPWDDTRSEINLIFSWDPSDTLLFRLWGLVPSTSTVGQYPLACRTMYQ